MDSDVSGYARTVPVYGLGTSRGRSEAIYDCLHLKRNQHGKVRFVEVNWLALRLRTFHFGIGDTDTNHPLAESGMTKKKGEGVGDHRPDFTGGTEVKLGW